MVKHLWLLPLLFLIACAPVEEVASVMRTPTPEPTLVRIVGAKTMAPLLDELARAYTRERAHVLIEVIGNGSQQGVEELIKGEAEMAMLSRPLQNEERLPDPNLPPLMSIPIARDGIALIVHPSNPINHLTNDQLTLMMTGALFEWDELGWLAGQIEVVSREMGSGDREIMKRLVLSDGVALSLNALLMPHPNAVVDYVASTPTAMGYVSLAHLSGVVKPLRLESNSPTREQVAANYYPLRRDLQLITRGEAEGEAREFIAWIKSAEGERIIERRYVPLP